MRRWPSRQLGLSLLLAAGSCLAAFTLAEATLRLAADHILREAEFVAVGTVFKVDDPPVGFSLLPGSSRIVARGGAFVIRERINRQGLRDVEHTREKPPGTKRILVLGDSFMYGDGVQPHETMPGRLGDLMPGVEVVNAGVRAYDLGQEYLYFRERVHAYRPDLVLLAFFINDLAPDATLEAVNAPDGLPLYYRRKPEVIARERAGAPSGLRGAVTSWLRAHSMLWVVVSKRADDMRLRRRGPGPVRRNNAADINYLAAFEAGPAGGGALDDWRRAHRILDELKSRAGSGDAHLAVVMIPAPWQLSEEAWGRWVEWLGVDPTSLSRRRPQEMVSAWCRASGTPCLDLLGSFEGGDRQRLYFRHDHHWTAEGHALAAGAVRTFLEQQGLP